MDAGTFKDRFFAYHPKLFRIAFALVGNKADAEDILQDAYGKLWNMRDELDGIRYPEAFAVTVTKNLCLDFLRSPARRTGELTERHEKVQGSATPDRSLEVRDKLEWVKRLIDRLPGKQQRVLRLHALEEFPLEEVAEMTGYSPANVRVILSRARKMIREQLEKSEYHE